MFNICASVKLYTSETTRNRALTARGKGSRSRWHLIAIFHCPGPRTKRVARGISVTSWAPSHTIVEYSFQRLQWSLPPDGNRVFLFFLSLSFLFALLRLRHFHLHVSPPFLASSWPRQSASARSFFSARIIRSFSPLMSGNYCVSTANDQWRSMIASLSRVHALREPATICSKAKQSWTGGWCAW